MTGVRSTHPLVAAGTHADAALNVADEAWPAKYSVTALADVRAGDRSLIFRPRLIQIEPRVVVGWDLLLGGARQIQANEAYVIFDEGLSQLVSPEKSCGQL